MDRAIAIGVFLRHVFSISASISRYIYFVVAVGELRRHKSRLYHHRPHIFKATFPPPPFRLRRLSVKRSSTGQEHSNRPRHFEPPSSSWHSQSQPSSIRRILRCWFFFYAPNDFGASLSLVDTNGNNGVWVLGQWSYEGCRTLDGPVPQVGPGCMTWYLRSGRSARTVSSPDQHQQPAKLRSMLLNPLPLFTQRTCSADSRKGMVHRQVLAPCEVSTAREYNYARKVSIYRVVGIPQALGGCWVLTAPEQQKQQHPDHYHASFLARSVSMRRFGHLGIYIRQVLRGRDEGEGRDEGVGT